METLNRKLYRSRTDKIIFGVCGGLAKYFDIGPVLIRALFVLSVVFQGFGILLYIVLAIIIPPEPENSEPQERGDIARDIKENAQSLAQEMKESFKEKNWLGSRKNIFGVIIVLAGIVFLLQNLFDFRFLRWNFIWPLLLIFVGIYIIYRE